MSALWADGAATAIGSMPGTDAAEATRTVFGELPLLPFVPELPARGPGADMIGRGSSFLLDLPVEIVPSGWRITAHPGRDLRRAQDFVSRDLDTLADVAAAGPLKVQLVGPWTLAASVELPSGHRVVTDHGAVRDLAASLGEGIRELLAQLASRVPDVPVVVQLDEPSLPSVLAGTVPTPSGYGTARSIDPVVVTQTLASVLDVAAAGSRAVHCCASSPPVALFRSAGADAVSVDLSVMTNADLDALGEAVDGGTSLWLGIVPSTDADISLDSARTRLLEFWSRLGMPVSTLGASVVPTPSCGLAGASLRYARHAMTVVREVGEAARELA